MKHPYLYLFRKSLIWFRQSLSFVWLIAVAGYLMVLAGNAMYRTYQGQEETAALQEKLRVALQEKERTQALLVYYQTDSFKEKELRRTLLMKRPGEKVYALPESSVARTVEEDAAQSTAAAKKKAASSEPTWRQWVTYIWTGDR